MNLVKTPDELFKILTRLGIDHKTENHKPIFTAIEGEFIKKIIPGAHVKNLFLKTKKDGFYLVTMLEDKRLNLKIFGQEMNLGSISFASDEDLLKYLGVEPGHVTPFALINDSAKNVKLILDKEMMEHEIHNFHPLRNDMTTSISREQFLEFLSHIEHNPMILTLPKLATCNQ